MRVSADRIVVVRAHAGVGAMLCAVPALRALRGTSPRAHIALVALPSAEWMLERFHTYVNEVIPFPGFPGMSPDAVDVRETVAFFSEMHERRVDLAVQLHGDDGASTAFTQLLGARATAGAHAPDAPSPDRDLFVASPTDEPEAIRLLRVVENIGARPPRGADPELPLTDDDRTELAAVTDGEVLEPGGYACLHAGPGPTERFTAVGAALAENGLRAVLIGGEEHAEVAAAVADGLDNEAGNLVGSLTLGGTAALLRDAAILVGAGSSMAQLAAAVQTPSVAIFPPGLDRTRWRPPDAERHRVLGDDAGVEDVLGAVEDLLGEGVSAAPAPR